MESSISARIATDVSKINTGGQILSTSYWFTTPNSLSLEKLIFPELVSSLVLAAVLLLLAYRYVNKSLNPPENKFLNRVILSTIWFGPAGWLLVIFRNWGVVFLSARFWWVLWSLVLLGVCFQLWRFYKISLPELKQRFASYHLKKRYFPRGMSAGKHYFPKKKR